MDLRYRGFEIGKRVQNRQKGPKSSFGDSLGSVLRGFWDPGFAWIYRETYRDLRFWAEKGSKRVQNRLFLVFLVKIAISGKPGFEIGCKQRPKIVKNGKITVFGLLR